jgi:uncharacterized protein (TIGR00725 family)
MKKDIHRRFVIGVMGGADVSADVMQLAYDLGCQIAENGWIVLNGGRDCGVMRASAEGAKSRGGMTIGILPGNSRDEANPFIDIAVVTDMGDARNAINVLSSDIVIALPGAAGTMSEIALALKNGKTVILLKNRLNSLFESYRSDGLLYCVDSVQECINLIKEFLSREIRSLKMNRNE